MRAKRRDEITAYFGPGCRIEGHVAFEGNMRIDGALNGSLEGVDGSVIIGETAVIHADIKGVTVMIRGKVYGTVEARERIEVCKPGSVCGDLFAPTVHIEKGVSFDGNCGVSKCG